MKTMILPIRVYGDPVLREQTIPVEGDSADLQALIDSMIETMRGAEGIGLAASQVGRTERVFVVDLAPLAEPDGGDGVAWPAQPMVFINPVIEEESDEECEYEEGCLSIPDLRELVVRSERIRVRYLDRTFTPQVLEADDVLARVIQHEYDHLDGVLFTDRITPFRRRLLQRRLREMARGEVTADYPLAVAGTV
jgi:peptide deformylase